MRVYRVEFEGYSLEFHHAATEAEIVELGFCDSEKLNAIALDSSITLSTKGFKYGWDVYPTVTFTAYDGPSYKCNCCLQEVSGDGAFNICSVCGWENDPDENLYPDEDCGPNHMSLNEGRANFKKHGWYKEPVKEEWIK